jgi:hypothetical protein
VALRRKARKKSSTSTKGSSSTASKSVAKSGKTSPGLLASLRNPRTLRRMLILVQTVGPPLVAGTMRVSTQVRGSLDERRAHQLGVSIDDVALYKGPAGTISARLSGLSKAVHDLRDRRGADPKVRRFTDTADARIVELYAAINATLSMPSGTRRSTLHAISADLDQLDSELMTFLVGPATT